MKPLFQIFAFFKRNVCRYSTESVVCGGGGGGGGGGGEGSAAGGFIEEMPIDLLESIARKLVSRSVSTR